MPNLNQLVLTGADFKVLINVPNALGAYTPYVLKTAKTLDYEVMLEDEVIHVIGSKLPIANKTNAKSYKGKLVVQLGEMNAIVGLAGYNDATDLQGCTLSITAIQGAFERTFTSLNFLTETASLTAKSKETPVTMNWSALGVNLE